MTGSPLLGSVREVFASAAAVYGRGNPLLTIERQETPLLLPELAGRDLLDLGSGPGSYAALARRLGARRAVSLDLTFEMLRAAPPPGVVGDCVSLPIRDESFDVAVAALVFSFVPDRRRAMCEAARVLRPGGVLVLSDLHPAASQRGWSRSFEGPRGERLVLDAPPPAADEVEAALAEAGLAIQVRREVIVDERLAPEFRRAGRKDFRSMYGSPLLLLFRACKRGHHER